jgi:predicted TIM-barrel fold metal-dependent hydrolase
MSSFTRSTLDAELYTPWLGADDSADPRADRVEWNDDARLKRVAQTFHHTDSGVVKTPFKSKADIFKEMDAANVEGAILAAKVYYRSSERSVDAVHAELATLATGSAGRLKIIATIVPPELGASTYWDVMQNSRFLEDAHRRYGAIGVHITPAPWGMAPSHKWFYPLYAKCVELGLCLFVYVGMPGPLWPMVPNDPTVLDEVALAFPDLKIIAHHIGDPWNDVVVRLAAKHRNYYICTSAWHPRSYPEPLVNFMKGKWHGTHGSEKVVFASDWPLLDMQKTVKAARELNLSQEQLSCILYENARRLFWP